MNDDYLWDKTGQPDPEIQQLEEILGTLRYQPKPLVLPRQRNYFPLLAIAASILNLRSCRRAISGGSWKGSCKSTMPGPEKLFDLSEGRTLRLSKDPRICNHGPARS